MFVSSDTDIRQLQMKEERPILSYGRPERRRLNANEAVQVVAFFAVYFSIIIPLGLLIGEFAQVLNTFWVLVLMVASALGALAIAVVFFRLFRRWFPLPHE